MYKCYPQDGQPNWKKCWQLIQNSFNVKQEFNMKVEKIWANFYSIKNFSFDLMKNKIWWLWRKSKINSILCNLFIGLVIDKFQFIYWIEIRIIQKKCQLLAFLKKMISGILIRQNIDDQENQINFDTLNVFHTKAEKNYLRLFIRISLISCVFCRNLLPSSSVP